MDEKAPFDFPGDPAELTADVVRPDSDPADAKLTERVVEALKTVRDPEIPVNLIDLGLIYELLVNKDGTVYVEMTLTTPACPAAIALPRGRECGETGRRHQGGASQSGMDAALDPGPDER